MNENDTYHKSTIKFFKILKNDLMLIKTESSIITIQLRDNYYVIAQDTKIGDWDSHHKLNGSNFELSKNQDFIVAASGT